MTQGRYERGSSGVRAVQVTSVRKNGCIVRPFANYEKEVIEKHSDTLDVLSCKILRRGALGNLRSRAQDVTVWA